MYAEETIELCFRDGIDRAVKAVTGVVDEIVEVDPAPIRPQGICNAIFESWKGSRVPHIELKRNGLTACCLDLMDHLPGTRVLAVVSQDDAETTPCAL